MKCNSLAIVLVCFSASLLVADEPKATTSGTSKSEFGDIQFAATTPPWKSDAKVEASDDLSVLRSRLGQLEGEIEQLRYEVPPPFCAAETGGSTACVPSATKCSTCWEPKVGIRVEVPFLRPQISGINPVFNVSPAANQFIDPNFDPAVRYVGELWPAESFGIRGTYFRYDHGSGFHPPYRPAMLDIELEAADFEFVFRHVACNWNVDLTAGLEYGRLQYAAVLATAVGVGRAAFEGVGPTFGVRAEHGLGSSSFSIFGMAKAAMLFGDINNSSLLVNVPRAKIHDEMTQVFSHQIGVSWQPDVIESGSLAIRAGWETQLWLNETLSDDSYGIGSNLGMTGPMISAEIVY